MREGAFQAPQRQSDRAVVDDREYGNPDEGCKAKELPTPKYMIASIIGTTRTKQRTN